MSILNIEGKKTKQTELNHRLVATSVANFTLDYTDICTFAIKSDHLPTLTSNWACHPIPFYCVEPYISISPANVIASHSIL